MCHSVKTLQRSVNGNESVRSSSNNSLCLENHEKLRIIADYTFHWEFWRDPFGKLLWVSPACKLVTGYSPEELLTDPDVLSNSIIHPDYHAIWQKHKSDILDNQTQYCDLEIRIVNKSGKILWIQHTCRPIFDSYGMYIGRRGCNVDITRRKLFEDTLRENAVSLRATLESTADGIIVIGNSGDIKHYNTQFLSMFSVPHHVLADGNHFKMFQHMQQQIRHTVALLENASAPSCSISTQQELIHLNNGKIFEQYSRPLVQHDQSVGRVLSFRDVTVSKQLEAKLSILAKTDPLTGVNNRREFLAHAEEEVVRSKRYGTPLAFLMLDIDMFKCINDSYGHAGGDEVLKALSNKCVEVLRVSDVFGRVGGEEFAAVLVHSNSDDCNNVANRLHTALSNLTVKSDGHNIRFTVSIGSSTLKSKEDTVEELLKRADSALYQAKMRGRNQVCMSL